MSFCYNNNRNVPRVLEHFGVGEVQINSDETTLTENQITNLVETTKAISDTTVTESCAKLLKSVINNVVNKNQASLLQALAASNSISMANGIIKGDFTLTNFTQENTVNLTANGDFIQKVQNDITTQISEEVKKTFLKEAQNAMSDTSGTDIGETLGKAMDAIADVGSAFIEGATEILEGSLSATVGSDTNETTRNISETKLIDTFKLDSTFKLVANDEFDTAVSNQLSTENLSNCNQEAKAKNDLDLSGIRIDGNANLSGIKQSNYVTAALDCAFNQDIVNQLAQILVTKYDNLVESMMSSTTTNNKGDIAAAGVAGKAVIAATGEAVSNAAQGVGSGVNEAAQGIGSGVNEAAQGIGSGVGDAAQGIGTGVGSAISGFAMNPVFLLCCCFCILMLIAGGAYVIMNKEQFGF